jgi:preprotein translocase subunit SecD
VVLAAACSEGGSERATVRLKARATPGHRLTVADLDRAVAVLRRRLRKLGARDVEITVERPQIVLKVPPRFASPRTVGVLTKTALLEFYDFEAHAVGLPRPTPPAVKPGTTVVRCNVQAGNCVGGQLPGGTGYYLFEGQPELTGADLDAAATRADVDPQTSAPVVLLRFTKRGSARFHDITRREAQRGAVLCAGSRAAADIPRCAQHFAIVLDHEILSAPYVDFVRNPDGIAGDNGAQVDLGSGGSLAAAKRLAVALQSGALPVRLVRVP